MKTTLSSILFLLSVNILNEQNRAIKKVLKELNSTIEVYEKLTPHGQEYYATDSLKITKQDIIRAFDAPLEHTNSILTLMHVI